MRTVRNLAQLARLRGEEPPKPPEPPKVDSVAVLAQEVKSASAKHEELMLTSIQAMHLVAQQFQRVPVLQMPPQYRRLCLSRSHKAQD